MSKTHFRENRLSGSTCEIAKKIDAMMEGRARAGLPPPRTGGAVYRLFCLMLRGETEYASRGALREQRERERGLVEMDFLNRPATSN